MIEFLRSLLGLPPRPRHARPGEYVVVQRDGIAFIVPRRAR